MYNSFTVILSNHCNLRCPYCLQDATLVKGREISAQELIHFFNSDKVDLQDLKLTGGEPLSPQVYSKTKALVEYALSKGIKTQVNTNGTYDLVDDFESGLLTFQVSVDGLREDHDNFRGKGVFDKALKFIETQQSKGHRIKVMRVIQEDYSLEEINKFIDFFINNFNLHPFFQPVAKSGRGKDYREKDISFDGELEGLLSNKKCKSRGVKTECGTPKGIYDKCGIDQFGNIIPCPLLQQYKFGTIYNFNEKRIRNEMALRTSKCTCAFPDGYEGN
jgi:MoaA/NifB/PqqE/SkfB family radical SAM enzyme